MPKLQLIDFIYPIILEINARMTGENHIYQRFFLFKYLKCILKRQPTLSAAKFNKESIYFYLLEESGSSRANPVSNHLTI
jgi:hypothetical protein